MKVKCTCGTQFESIGSFAKCPKCRNRYSISANNRMNEDDNTMLYLTAAMMVMESSEIQVHQALVLVMTQIQAIQVLVLVLVQVMTQVQALIVQVQVQVLVEVINEKRIHFN